MVISSMSNEKVKYIKSLNERKYREKNSAFYIEGVKVISELIDIYKEKAVNIEFIAYSLDILKNVNGGEKLINKLQKVDCQVFEMSSKIITEISDAVNSQGIIAVIKYEKKTLLDIDSTSNILILDKVQDSGNVGTIIRSANAFNVKNIVLIKGSADAYSPKVVRSTMLGIVIPNIIYIENIDDLFHFLKDNDYEIISTALHDKSIKLNDFKFSKKSAIVLGNESSGVEEEFIKKSNKILKIEIEENVESLNVAQAASIVLYKQYIEKKV